MHKLQMKHFTKKTVILLSSILTINLTLPAQLAYAGTSYDYSNSIYSEGTEDTYLYEANDKVVTTKTGVKRILPETIGAYDLSYYPIPLTNQVPSEEAFNLIKAENKELMARVETDIQNGSLKKHIAADGQFYGTISDKALGVEKKIYLNTNNKGTHSLAAYVPAGEVATVTLNEEALSYAREGLLTISVGMTEIDADEYEDNHDENNRMPYTGKTFSITENETKVGTPFGGMVYINVSYKVPSGLQLEAEIKGVVDAPYYELGQTTSKEWQTAKEAPGLFAEIRTPYLRFMVPSYFIREIEDPYKACLFWTDSTAFSATVMAHESNTTPMTLVFDDYIVGAEAYATLGGWLCNLPTKWITDALTYESLMESGSWGVIHEINHHYQSRYLSYYDEWGLGEDFGEISNNALNAISYLLYTNIAAYRSESGLDGWNKVADPYSSLKEQMAEGSNGTPNIGTFMYSTLAHEIGPVTLGSVIQSTYEGADFNGIHVPAYDYKAESEGKMKRDERYDDFAYRICVASERDYTWYMQEELNWPLSSARVNKIADLNYKKVIPVASVYAMGEAGRETGRAYYVPSTGSIFNFEESLISPANATVINVSTPKYGTLKKLDDGTYSYVPGSAMLKGENDEFVLTVQAEADGIITERKLNCTIGISYENVTVEHYNITKWDLAEALEALKTTTSHATESSRGMRINTEEGNNLAKATGYFTVVKSGNYTFQAFGDDQAVFQLTKKDGTVLQSQTTDYASSAKEAYAQSTATHFTVQLEANTPYAYTIISNNNGGSGWADVNVLSSASASWNSIKTVYGNLKESGKNVIRNFTSPSPVYVRPSVLAAADSYQLKGVSVISTPQGVSASEDAGALNEWDPENIIDGDVNTYFHSSYTDSNRTPFPHDYIFDLGSQQSFNGMEMLYRRSGDDCGVIGNYEIWIADNYDKNTEWTLLTADHTRNGNASATEDIQIAFEAVSARYVKLRALNNRGTYNLSILAEVAFTMKSSVNNVIAQNSSYIQYTGSWTKDTEGVYVNGATYNTTNGVFAYCFNGSETNLYVTENARAEVRIDGGSWRSVILTGSLRVPAATLAMEESGDHLVEVRAVGETVALNMISTNGTFFKGTLPSTKNTLTIKGADNIEIPVSKISSFDALAGVSYTDKLGITDLEIKVSGSIGKPASGTNQKYKLIYSVTDYYQNTASAVRYVTVTNQAPVINGLSDISITVGEGKNFDYAKGVTATDYEDRRLKSITLPTKNLSTLSVGNYTVSYKAVDSDGNVTTSIRKVTVKPKAVQKVTAVSTFTSNVKLSWSRVTGASGYKVYRYSTAKKKYVLIKTITKNTTLTYTDSKLSSGTTYKYKVTAYSKTVASAAKTASATTRLTASKITRITTSSKKAAITWSKIKNATGYEVYRSTTKNGTYQKIATIKSGKTVKFTNVKLTANKTYYYKVRAYRVVNKDKVYGASSTAKSVKVSK